MHKSNYQLCKILGGSRLYQLQTPQSDTDYRGVFVNTSPSDIFGLTQDTQLVSDAEDDVVYYELRKFFNLCKKANTQSLDILFAPEESYVVNNPEWETITENRYDLFSSESLKKSLSGYIGGEIRLMLGERTGLLGSKRKEALEKYGYSYKNYVQLRRLIATGIHFFTTGEYQVVVEKPLLEELIAVKLNPSMLTKEQALEKVREQEDVFLQLLKTTDVLYEYDEDLVVDIAKEIYIKFL
jgi:predicted nucleotidyltransferase